MTDKGRIRNISDSLRNFIKRSYNFSNDKDESFFGGLAYSKDIFVSIRSENFCRYLPEVIEKMMNDNYQSCLDSGKYKCIADEGKTSFSENVRTGSIVLNLYKKDKSLCVENIIANIYLHVYVYCLVFQTV